MVMEIDCNRCSNTNCLLKKSNIVALINSLKSTYKLKAEQFVFKENFQFDGIYIIQSGKVKVVSFGYKNRVQTIRLTKNGDLLGYRALGQNTFSNSAITIEDSTLCFLEGELFYELLKKENVLAYNLMLFYAEELRIAEVRMKTLSQMTVNEKVIDAILIAYNNYGTIDNNGILEIDADLSRVDISEVAGIRSDQFIKVFSELKNMGKIHFNKNKHLIIDDIEYLRDQVKIYR
ncbi:MAG: Crp/Fnr family transcriptional regulator [Bacteroidia bacterium]|nr:Crp/Fnr family transcriptional regulator [Bacteroidia bacterium]